MLFVHIRTIWIVKWLKCFENWSNSIMKNDVPPNWVNCDFVRLNMRIFKNCVISNWFLQMKTDDKQRKNENCSGHERSNVKTERRVFEIMRCRWIMKHGRQIQRGEKMFEFGKSIPNMNGKSKRNIRTKKRNFDWKLYLNNIQNEMTCFCCMIVAFGLIVWMRWKICSGIYWSKSAWLWNIDRLKRLLFRRKQTGEFAI